MPRRLRLAVTLAIVIVALVLLAVFGLASTHNPAGGRRAPALPTERLAGPAVTLKSMLAAAGGHPVLVVFWASWCGPCTREAPAVERFARSAAGRGRIVGVDWSDGRSGASSFVHRYGWSFPVLRDAEGTVGNDYRLANLPTTFVIDDQQRILATLRGPQSQASLTKALRASET